MIHSVERTALGVLAALRAGRFHAMYTRDGQPPIELLACELEGDVLTVRVGETADVIRFIGQHGRILRDERKRSEASYTVTADDPYVRVEVVARRRDPLPEPADPLGRRRAAQARSALPDREDLGDPRGGCARPRARGHRLARNST